MKINKILLHNVGPYIGSNEFCFNTADKQRSIVLIGGKNGAGKTTLFNSIKIGLYGCKAFGFESVNIDYLDEVNKLINTNEKLNKNSYAKVIIEILIDDGKNDDIFIIERKWSFSTKRIKERVIICKNNKTLGERETLDFENYLNQIVPPDLFKFYFFDGEKIGDFVLNATVNNDFKNAFLKLCGLDTLELIKENFKRIYKKKNPDSYILNQYSEVLKSINDLDAFLIEKNAKQKDLLSEIDKINDQVALLEKAYYQQGGLNKKNWDSMHEQLRKEESLRDQTRQWLREIANEILPFLILKNELESLKLRTFQEETLHNYEIVKKTLQEKGRQAITSILNKANVESVEKIAKDIIISLIECLNKGESNFIEILHLSATEQFDLNSKITAILSFDSKKIADAVNVINESLEKTKKIRKKIEKTDMSNWQIYLEKTNDFLSTKNKLMEECFIIEHEISENVIKKQSLEQELKKIKTKYESELKFRSLNDISAKAILAFEKLQSKLYKKFISQVEEKFCECFNQLINKQNLLDGIIIDDNLAVYPYKNRLFSRQEINALIYKYGEEHIKALVGVKAFEILREKLNNLDDQIILPIEINQTLSAGEKQVFIMSIYFALSQINPISVPYIIDTPFSRIDSQHRKNILEQFFMRLKGQIIILSTDEEIVHSYSDILAEKTSNQFLLEHQSDGCTKIIANKYFGDVT